MPRRRLRESQPAYSVENGVLVDSSVLIDLIKDDPRWGAWSVARLEPLLREGRAIINPIIYAEISAGFSQLDDLERTIGPLGLRREPLPWEAAFLAARAYKLYRRRGGQRRSPLPDFYIGAHAANAGYPLLTRDTARYRDYFPGLVLMAPEIGEAP